MRAVLDAEALNALMVSGHPWHLAIATASNGVRQATPL